MALSKNRIKYIRSLELKKNRKADKVFLAVFLMDYPYLL